VFWSQVRSVIYLSMLASALLVYGSALCSSFLNRTPRMLWIIHTAVSHIKSCFQNLEYISRSYFLIRCQRTSVWWARRSRTRGKGRCQFSCCKIECLLLVVTNIVIDWSRLSLTILVVVFVRPYVEPTARLQHGTHLLNTNLLIIDISTIPHLALNLQNRYHALWRRFL